MHRVHSVQDLTKWCDALSTTHHRLSEKSAGGTPTTRTCAAADSSGTSARCWKRFWNMYSCHSRRPTSQITNTATPFSR